MIKINKNHSALNFWGNFLPFPTNVSKKSLRKMSQYDSVSWIDFHYSYDISIHACIGTSLQNHRMQFWGLDPENVDPVTGNSDLASASGLPVT